MFYSVFSTMISFLPDSNGLDPDIQNSIINVWGYIKAYSYILPVSSMFIVLGLALSFHLSIFLYRLVNWVIGKLRGSN